MRIESVLAAIGRHSVLIALAVMFSYPFVWMVATSAKVDREMFSEERPLLPRAPVPRAQSPYVDETEFAAPAVPDELAPTRASALAPGVLDALRAFVVSASTTHAELTLPGAQSEALEGLWERILALTPHAV